MKVQLKIYYKTGACQTIYTDYESLTIGRNEIRVYEKEGLEEYNYHDMEKWTIEPDKEAENESCSRFALERLEVIQQNLMDIMDELRHTDMKEYAEIDRLYDEIEKLSDQMKTKYNIEDM